MVGRMVAADVREEALELFPMARPRPRFVGLQRTLTDQLREAFLEGKRPGASRDGDLLVEMLQRVLPDVLPRAVADDQQFSGRHASAAALRHQHLRHHRRERHRELLSNGRLALGGECVRDP